MDSEQLTLDISSPTSDIENDFLISPSNIAAWKIIETFPHWDFNLSIISGERLCGETTLAKIFAQKFNVPLIDFSEISNFKFAPSAVAIDNFQPTLLREQEEQLCHLYDEALAYDKKILLLGRSFDLSKIERIDLKTRLQSSLHAKILPPDDILGGQLLLKLLKVI